MVRLMKPIDADPILEELLKKAKKHVMTSEEKRAQAISFAFGNLAMSNPNITREMVERTYDKLIGKEEIKP